MYYLWCSKSLCITAPCNGNLVPVDLMQSMIDKQSWAAEKHIPLKPILCMGKCAIITEARNRCVAEFHNETCSVVLINFSSTLTLQLECKPWRSNWRRIKDHGCRALPEQVNRLGVLGISCHQ